MFQVYSDRAESADWPRPAHLRGLLGDIGADSGPGAVGEDADSARMRTLSHALNIRRVDAAASMECPQTSVGSQPPSPLDRALDSRELSLRQHGAALNQAANNADAGSDSAVA